MYKEILIEQEISTISISDEELNDDGNAADNISGLLQSSRDLFLRTAAFEFGSSFFRIRGLDSDNAKILINGVEMNTIFSGRPQWSNWGGLNDVTRNQEFSSGLSPSSYTFGGILGSTNINIRASEARAGTKISYATSNKSYQHRAMVTYASGILKNDWSFLLSASRRAGNEGFNDGTFYDANSIFIGVEKKLNNNHSVNFSAFYTPNNRGKSSANTEAVYRIKGIQYNSYWGIQNGKKRNSRTKKTIAPSFLLNHYWNLTKNTSIQTNIAYQFGKVANSRIDYNGSKLDGTINRIPTIVSLGGSNPDPTYYQKLPSYGIKQNDINVYETLQKFYNDGQVDWKSMYQTNANTFNNGYAAYVLYEDRSDNNVFTINSILNSEFSENITLNAGVAYKKLSSLNYAQVVDLLGGEKFLDVDNFAQTNDLKQNDLQNPFREVVENEKFKYNYHLRAIITDGFLQAQFNYNKVDFYAATKLSKSTYQRIGNYQNGKFSEDNASLGVSKKSSFLNYGLKAGGTFKITGRHLLNMNVGLTSRAPTLRNTFSNARVNNSIVDDLISEKRFVVDGSYIFRSPIIQAKLTGYFTKIEDATKVSFYYADGIGGSGSDYTAFVQEIITGIDTQITSSLKIKAATNVGQYIYTNNPILTLKSEVDDFQFNARPSNLKNYKVAGGPQHAYSVGFEYRDPNYWWFGTTINFFNKTYISIAPLTRTNNFSNDEGIPFNDFDPIIARKLLQQEQFKAYNVINLIGGKSWKVHKTFFSVFASINNLQNTKYKTGGFEQGRNANYRELRDDKALDTPIFGSKYWYGKGTTYFIILNLRF